MMFARFRGIFLLVAILAAVAGANILIFGQYHETTRLIFTCIGGMAITIGLSYAQRTSNKPHDGWKVLSTSLAEWLGVILAIAMTAIFFWVFYFVGSARADADFQMNVLKVLLVVFSVISALAVWSAFSTVTRWNGEKIEQHMLYFGAKTIQFADIISIKELRFLGCVQITDRDGTWIHIPVMHNGAPEFLAELLQKLGIAEFP